MYDLIVIGAGPAGMMAAIRASNDGQSVLILEKNFQPGIKLLMTGKGRCNITNVNIDSKKPQDAYGEKGKFLFSAFNAFGVEDLMNFFESHGLRLKIEDRGRVFPASDKGRDVLNLLMKIMKENKVELRLNSPVSKIICEKKNIQKIILKSGEELSAKKYLITTGGASYPASGSSGDAYAWCVKMGHRIVSPRPALVPMQIGELRKADLEGLSFSDIGFGIWEEEKKIIALDGDCIFTADGLSGPVILNLTRSEFDIVKSFLKIDFFPSKNFVELEKEVLENFSKKNNKKISNALEEFLPQRMVYFILDKIKINFEKKVNLISREERRAIIENFKCLSLKISSLSGFDKAVVTRGGVDLSEVDPKTMRSKIVDNLYFAGEVLDLDGPSGGYNLQIAWSTGALSAIKN